MAMEHETITGVASKMTYAGASGADTSAIVAEKKRLRDITSQVDGVTTLDELKQITV